MKTPEERYHNISSWEAMRILRHEYDVISIEDYSMGSRGRVFQEAARMLHSKV